MNYACLHLVAVPGCRQPTPRAHLQSARPHRAPQPVILTGSTPVRLYDNPTGTVIQPRKRFTTLTNGPSIPDIIDGLQEPYYAITQIHITLAHTMDMDSDKSPLVGARVKFKHPEAYSGGSDLEEFEGFVANILRWFNMNYFWGQPAWTLIGVA
jgi:hypothetical protein